MKEPKSIKKNKFKYYYLYILLVVVILIGGLAFSYIKLNEAAEEVAVQQAILNQYMLEELKINTLIQDSEDVNSQSDIIDSAIPDKSKLVDFIESIEEIGIILGLNLSIDMSEGVVDEDGVVVEIESESTERITSYSGIANIEVLEVGITIRSNPGDFSSIINFIGMLEDLKYYSKIVDLKFISGVDDSGESYLDSLFTLNLYVKSGGAD